MGAWIVCYREGVCCLDPDCDYYRVCWRNYGAYTEEPERTLTAVERLAAGLLTPDSPLLPEESGDV